MRNELCTLVAIWQEEGRLKRKETEVYCGRKSAGRSEFYAAYAVGLKPRFVLEIDPADWEWASERTVKDGQPVKVLYQGVEYNIYRDFVTDESSMELTVG